MGFVNLVKYVRKKGFDGHVYWVFKGLQGCELTAFKNILDFNTDTDFPVSVGITITLN